MVDIGYKVSSNAESGLDKFEQAVVKEVVLISSAAAMAKVIYDEVKLNTSPPRMGRLTGNLHNAIYRTYSRERSSDGTKVYVVSVNKRKAPHWHWLEYGNVVLPAHPYIRPAFDHVQKAIEAGRRRMRERLASMSGSKFASAIEVSES